MSGAYAFPRHERLTRRAEYLALYRDGQKQVGRSFVCYVARKPGYERKFGYAVSRKVGQAVVRNRVKRYLREVYRLNRSALPEDVHIVFVARPAAAHLSFAECDDAVRSLLERSGVL